MTRDRNHTLGSNTALVRGGVKSPNRQITQSPNVRIAQSPNPSIFALFTGAAFAALMIGASCEPSSVPGTRVETVVSGVNFGIAMAFTPDGRIFYTEKSTGRVRVISAAGELLAEPLLDVPVVSNSERGLLGVAVHPDFATNGWVYVYYTRSNGGDSSVDSSAVDNRVVRFTVAGDTVEGGETLLITLPVTPGPRHNAGNVHFGPDGKLYVSVGDLENSDSAQNIDARTGRILRLNDDGTIPDDNPFGADNPTFALGLRNSFDFTFDPVSGALFATENSTVNHDEVNRLPAGANGGWPTVEGDVEGDAEVGAGDYVDPVVDFTGGSVVPTGIDFAPDATFGEQGAMYVALNNRGTIVRVSLNAARDQAADQITFADGITNIHDLAFAPDGSLYVVTLDSILRIVPDSTADGG